MLYRKPTFDDAEAIYELVYSYAQDGLMLARSRNVIYESLRDLIVADDAGSVVGVGGLYFTWEKLAEVRMLAVDRAMFRRGIGREIVARLLDEGKTFGVEKAFTLTYRPDFFGSLGFSVIKKEELPPKIWKDCIDCPKFPNCDEVALIKELS